VVLDQPQLAARLGEHAGAVLPAGRLAGPVVQVGLTGPGDDAVAESGRQRQHAGRVVYERGEGAAAGSAVRRGGRGGRAQGRDGAGYGEADAGGSAGQKLTTRHSHYPDSSWFRGRDAYPEQPRRSPDEHPASARRPSGYQWRGT